MAGLDDILDAASIVIDPAAMAPYLLDWRGRMRGAARAVVKPRTTEDIAAILRWASDTGTPIVPQGGNTGLSGGATPDDSGRAVILSLERMNRIRAIDPVGNTLVAEAGCVLANVQQAARDAGRLFPVSLGSEGSCQIGGILATNAGGIDVVRYGMTRDLVLGLEYVTASGMIVPGPSRLRKDNAGYDLRHLLIGSGGTLAIITAAALRLVVPPAARTSVLCGLADPVAALALLRRLRDGVGERIVSFELMCDGEMALIFETFPELRFPLNERHPWYVFAEVGGDDDAALTQQVVSLMGEAVEAGEVRDAVSAQSEAQSRAIWHLRFAVSEANRRAGPTASHDVSVATQDVPEFLAAVERAIARDFPSARMLVVGHLGDGNMHVTMVMPRERPDADREMSREIWAARVNDTVFAVVKEFYGSISAEHGIGRSGRSAFRAASDPTAFALMQGIKRVFDPAGILNPGVLFDR